MYFQGWSPSNYIQHKGGTISCIVKIMVQLTLTVMAPEVYSVDT